MKSKQYIAVLCILSGAAAAHADLSLDFESLPNQYTSSDIGANYNGPYVAPSGGGAWVTFGSGVQGAPATTGSLFTGANLGPFVNGNIGLLSANSQGSFNFGFNSGLGQVSSVTFTYSSWIGMTFQALQGSTPIGSATSLSSTVIGGFNGSQNVPTKQTFTLPAGATGFELLDAANDVSANPFGPDGNSFVTDLQNDPFDQIGQTASGLSFVDDLNISSDITPDLLPPPVQPGTVPDASSTLGLLGLAGAGMLALRRKAVVS